MKAVELRNITKRFGNVIANNSIDLDVNQREIHCLLGENGAGKTTLMKILFGLLLIPILFAPAFAETNTQTLPTDVGTLDVKLMYTTYTTHGTPQRIMYCEESKQQYKINNNSQVFYH